MNTVTDINIDGFISNILKSYESRIQKIQNTFQSTENLTESSHSLFDSVHNSLSDLRKKRDQVNIILCETIAKTGSLRKKDYNMMMSGIISALDEKESNAEKQFLSFIESQKETARQLKTSLLGIKDITSKDTTGKIALLREQLNQISEQQELKKETVMKTIINFQNMHNKLMECLDSLVDKGDKIQVKDIKCIKDQLIKEINQSKEINNH